MLGLATVAQAQQGSCNLNRAVVPLNAACCPRQNACPEGVPQVCSAACRTSWNDFSSACRTQIVSDLGTGASAQRLNVIFTTVSELCDDESGGRPAGQTGTCPSLSAPAGT
eukprot:SAG31_NODE_6832_length_1875_cov_1.641892_2_plen_110_part_01